MYIGPFIKCKLPYEVFYKLEVDKLAIICRIDDYDIMVPNKWVDVDKLGFRFQSICSIEDMQYAMYSGILDRFRDIYAKELDQMREYNPEVMFGCVDDFN